MTTREIKCPRCGKPTLFTPENLSRPFCSDRCKLIDLGAWADEAYAIPVKPTAGADNMIEEETEDDESGGNHDAKRSSSSGHEDGNPPVH